MEIDYLMVIISDHLKSMIITMGFRWIVTKEIYDYLHGQL